MMENIQELIYKTYSLAEVVPQSVQWALLGLGAFKVSEHFLAVAKGNSARGSLIIICLNLSGQNVFHNHVAYNFDIFPFQGLGGTFSDHGGI